VQYGFAYCTLLRRNGALRLAIAPCATPATVRPAAIKEGPAVATYVLVHGAWHGGWCYRHVARLLRNAGHDVFTPTLTGLGERVHLAALSTGLSTHIDDIAAVIECEELADVVLCGHSYGGMVVTGVADRVPDKIKSLVYLDAFLPEHGKALWDYISEGEKAFFLAGAAALGGTRMAPIPAEAFACTDPAWANRRNVPQPIGTFLEAVKLENDAFAGPKTYIFAEGWGRDGPILTPFRKFYDRVKDDAAWRVHTISAGHDVMIDDPDGLARLLLALA
jgi:pimeloyl-ACP methyl ester carboxylesterase